MIIQGDSLHKLKELEANSVDAVVTDPPYGLSFMGKAWDYDVPKCELWREVLRVLKPGGHMLAFFGTRTYHRGVVAIEDAGFEIRDQLQWIYGSGFPKSLNIGKAIDKTQGFEREVIGKYQFPDGSTRVTERTTSKRVQQLHGDKHTPITKPATAEAKLWDGWGTALKPANEPIVLARKPLSENTVAKNVLKWGTGAINVDESRIEYKSENDMDPRTGKGQTFNSDRKMYGGNSYLESKTKAMFGGSPQGRWPANVLFDESAAQLLGEPSRFFYVAKSSKRDRNSNGAVNNIHPTCKPTKLMQYLIKLITPPSGVVLDPFMGSGSTGVAAIAMNYKFIGIELNKEYAEIAEKRINDTNRITATRI